MLRSSLVAVVLLVVSCWGPAVRAQDSAPTPFYVLPDLEELLQGGMRDLVDQFSTDRSALRRWWDVPLSPNRRARERELLNAWRTGLDALPFEQFSTDDRVDWLLLQNRLAYEQARLDLDESEAEETASLLPFAIELAGMQESRRAHVPLDPAAAAEALDRMKDEVEALKKRVERTGAGTGADADADADAEPLHADRLVANRAASQVRSLRRTLDSWAGYYSGYDPLFTWWCAQPVEALGESLDAYAKHLRETVAGVKQDDTDTILGDPIGREALIAELQRELIPYTPEELMEIAEAEFAWCDAEMAKAAAELGFGDDWRAAQDHVKTLHVEPGQQPELIRMLADEAVTFLRERELLTVPPFAEHVWRMEMMTPARQKFTPYFTGGEVISVSFPTDGMEHGDKLMSMRGNNEHFSRATVHHELIPGHHLQGYMTQRHSRHRRFFNTPFWGEGWALYWEMLLWDEGFQRSPEDRIGMLFWRKHRCARILFSLGFHLGELTTDECIALLTERVGHELANATAEVRRSVQGGYGPLYQAAYMLGGLQFRALHRELVQSGQMANRVFHDAILREGPISVEMVRALLTDQELTRDFETSWRFYDE